MAEITWGAASDWDNAQSENNVVHDDIGVRSSSRVSLGYEMGKGVLSDNVALYLPMDDTSGTETDYSGNGNHGDVYSVSRGQTGIAGSNAHHYNSSNNAYTEIPYDSTLDITGDLTLAFWAKSPTSTWNAQWGGISKYDQYLLGAQGATDYNGIAFIFNDGSGWYPSNYSTQSWNDPSDITIWHLYVGTLDTTNGEVRKYVDDSLVKTVSTSASPGTESGPVHLGHREGEAVGTDHADIHLSDVLVLTKTVDLNDVQWLYNCAVSGNLTTAPKQP